MKLQLFTGSQHKIIKTQNDVESRTLIAMRHARPEISDAIAGYAEALADVFPRAKCDPERKVVAIR